MAVDFIVGKKEAIAAIVFQLVQYLIIIIGGTARFCKYKDTGRFNRNTQWPASFKFKFTLQITELLTVIALLATYASFYK